LTDTPLPAWSGGSRSSRSPHRLPVVKPKINSPDYQLHLPPLGDGSYGAVYRATYRGVVDRAVKVFKPEVADLSAMMRELEKLASVGEHEGIVTLHDFDLDHEPPYYVMSLHADQAKNGAWTSRTLDSVCGRVDAREAARLIDQIAEAMAYLHRHQVLHCDLKPRNILLTDETPPRVKICDFGQSRGVRVAHAAGPGTLVYSSPEQVLRPDDWLDGKGFRWDVYSFGVVAYKLATGRLPRLQDLLDKPDLENGDRTLEEPSDSEASERSAGQRRAHRIGKRLEENAEVTWPPRTRLDARRRAIITRCLSLDPAKRPADMREVRNAIHRLKQESRAVRSRNLAILFAVISAAALLASGKALFEASRARQAIARQDEKRREAEELVHFIIYNLSENLEPAGRAELLEHIAENAATYFSNLSPDFRTDRSLRSFARILETRGRAALAQENAEVAIDAFRKAFNLYEQLDGDGEGGRGSRTSSVLRRLGQAHALAGATEEARTAYRKALETAPDPATPEQSLGARLDRAEIHRELAGVEREEDRLDEALNEMNRALEIYRELGETEEGRQSLDRWNGLLGTLLESAELHRRKLDREQAADTLLEVIELGREALPRFRRTSALQRRMAEACHDLALQALAEDDAASARTYFEEEVRLREPIYWRRPTEAERSFLMARSLASLASTHFLDEPEEQARALRLYENALERVENVEDAGEHRERIDALRQFCREEIAAIHGRGE